KTQAQAQANRIPAPDVHPAPLAPPPIQASASPVGQAINAAQFSARPGRDQLVRVEVLLSRAHFSPGVIDGRDGENLKNALAAYQRANGMHADGILNTDVWNRLSQDQAPVVTDYVITDQDVAGPFAPVIPTDYGQMAKLDRLSYTSPLERSPRSSTWTRC